MDAAHLALVVLDFTRLEAASGALIHDQFARATATPRIAAFVVNRTDQRRTGDRRAADVIRFVRRQFPDDDCPVGETAARSGLVATRWLRANDAAATDEDVSSRSHLERYQLAEDDVVGKIESGLTIMQRVRFPAELRKRLAGDCYHRAEEAGTVSELDTLSVPEVSE